jgi:hypothetical protein
MLMVKDLHPSKHYLPKYIVIVRLFIFSLSHHVQTLITMNYICTFGLTEGMSPRVTCE